MYLNSGFTSSICFGVLGLNKNEAGLWEKVYVYCLEKKTSLLWKAVGLLLKNDVDERRWDQLLARHAQVQH